MLTIDKTRPNIHSKLMSFKTCWTTLARKFHFIMGQPIRSNVLDYEYHNHVCHSTFFGIRRAASETMFYIYPHLADNGAFDIGMSNIKDINTQYPLYYGPYTAGDARLISALCKGLYAQMEPDDRIALVNLHVRMPVSGQVADGAEVPDTEADGDD